MERHRTYLFRSDTIMSARQYCISSVDITHEGGKEENVSRRYPLISLHRLFNSQYRFLSSIVDITIVNAKNVFDYCIDAFNTSSDLRSLYRSNSARTIGREFHLPFSYESRSNYSFLVVAKEHTIRAHGIKASLCYRMQ